MPGKASEQADGSSESPASGLLKLAFIGKPNVGKSSLVNRLLGEERVLVDDQPGTTRDPIDTPFSFGGREYLLVDTAGMRRRRSIDTLTEHVAAKMARDQLDRCDVAALVIDAREGATAEDARLANLIEDSGRCAIVVLNKKDLVGRAAIDARSNRRARRWPSCAMRRCCSLRAVTRAGVTTFWSRRPRLRAGLARISTGELNKLLEQIVAQKPPPSGRGRRHVKLYYATQAAVAPADLLPQHQPPDRGRLPVPPLPHRPAARGLRVRRDPGAPGPARAPPKEDRAAGRRGGRR